MNQSKIVSFLDISPIVRYSQYIENATRNNHLVPWRYIYDYEFIFIVHGSLEVQTTKESYVLQTNDIHIMSPNIWHRRQIPDDKTCSYYSIHFDFLPLGSKHEFSPEDTYLSQCNRPGHSVALIDETLLNRPLHVLGNIELPKKLRVLDPIRYTKILKRIVECCTEKPFAYEIDIKADMLKLLKQILIDTRSHLVNSPRDNDHLAAIVQFVLDNYQTSIDYNQLCHMYGYSYENFRKLFKRHTGKSPTAFITDLRIEKAIELLYTGEYTVTEVAFMVGYSDSGYFSRLFRKQKGISPSQLLHSKINAPQATPDSTNSDAKEDDSV